jgi:hypothetical protein
MRRISRELPMPEIGWGIGPDKMGAKNGIVKGLRDAGIATNKKNR